MAKRIKKKACELGEHKCLFQLGRDRCLAFPAKGINHFDGSPTVIFRPISTIQYHECMKVKVDTRGTNTWDVIGQTTGWYTPDEDEAGRAASMVRKKTEKSGGQSGNESKKVAVETTKKRGITFIDDGTHRVSKNKKGEVVGVETSLFAQD